MIEYKIAQSEGNKIAQIATNLDAVELTPQQEQACILLASGESYTAVAQRLNINRGTLYKWQEITSFRCFYNKQCAIYKSEIHNALFGLHKDAIKVLSELLQSGKDGIRLKAATWILDKVGGIGGGSEQTQIIKELLREKCTYTIDNTIYFDDEDYNKMLSQYGIIDYDGLLQGGDVIQ